MIVIKGMSVNNQDYIMIHPERNLNVWPKFHGNPCNSWFCMHLVQIFQSGPKRWANWPNCSNVFQKGPSLLDFESFQTKQNSYIFWSEFKGFKNIQYRIVSLEEDRINSFLQQHNNHFLYLQWLIFQCCVVGVYKLPCWHHKHWCSEMRSEDHMQLESVSVRKQWLDEPVV